MIKVEMKSPFGDGPKCGDCLLRDVEVVTLNPDGSCPVCDRPARAPTKKKATKKKKSAE